MSGCRSIAAALLMVLLGTSVVGALGKVVNVFGPDGWRVLNGEDPWNPPQLFEGDVLNFTYSATDHMGKHNVWKLPNKQAYDKCNFTGGVALGNATTVMLRLNRKGRYYFACSAVAESSHCMMGQKVSVRIYRVTKVAKSIPQNLPLNVQPQHKLAMAQPTEPSLPGNVPLAAKPRKKKTKMVPVFSPIGWVIPPAGFKWAQPQIHAGDRLNFSSPTSGPLYSVFKMKDAAKWQACNFDGATQVGSAHQVIGRLPKSGTFYYAGEAANCQKGQKFMLKVLPRIRDAPLKPAVEVIFPIPAVVVAPIPTKEIPKPQPTPVAQPKTQPKPSTLPKTAPKVQPETTPPPALQGKGQPKANPKLQPKVLQKGQPNLQPQPELKPKTQPAKAPSPLSKKVTAPAPAKKIAPPKQVAPKVINVFGDSGWRVPPVGFNWTASTPVYVGDTLNFTWVPGPLSYHDVNLMASKAAFDSCSFTGAKILPTWKKPPVLIKLEEPGLHFFACSVLGFHCLAGQKAAFNVLPQ